MLKLRRSEDFERVLRLRSAASGPHFALHHLAAEPSRPRPRHPRSSLGPRVEGSLSTPGVPLAVPVVDAVPVRSDACWFGAVVPKRHARRAVTRTLLKRQIRAAADRHAGRLQSGLWVVRLKAPFDRERFVSAASVQLRSAAREELDGLFVRASGRR